MNDFVAYGWIVVGSIAAFLYPYLREFLKRQFAEVAGPMPPWAGKYLALLILGLISGGVVLALAKQHDPGFSPAWYTAWLMGFSAESTIEQLLGAKR